MRSLIRYLKQQTGSLCQSSSHTAALWPWIGGSGFDLWGFRRHNVGWPTSKWSPLWQEILERSGSNKPVFGSYAMTLGGVGGLPVSHCQKPQRCWEARPAHIRGWRKTFFLGLWRWRRVHVQTTRLFFFFKLPAHWLEMAINKSLFGPFLAQPGTTRESQVGARKADLTSIIDS